MKRTIVLLALVFVVVASIGCGAKNSEAQTKQAEDYKATKNDK